MRRYLVLLLSIFLLLLPLQTALGGTAPAKIHPNPTMGRNETERGDNGTCGNYSGPDGQPRAANKPVIAHAVGSALGAVKPAILQAALHGITGFSLDTATVSNSLLGQILQCSHTMQARLGFMFSSATLLNVSAGESKQALHNSLAPLIGTYMNDEAYLHIDLGGKTRPVLFIYYGAEESDDPTIIQTLTWLRGTPGAQNVVFLVDPGPDCRVSTPNLSVDQMLKYIDGVYIDDDCNANSQDVMSASIRDWNQRHGHNKQKAWFATARAGDQGTVTDPGAYGQNWSTAIGTDPVGIAICSWNNPSYPDIAGNKPLLHITRVKSKAWRG